MMPSVTNVNNVSIVTGEYPSAHGISSNYRMVRETGEDIYMESGEYILSETLFQRANRKGARTILSTSKDKLRTLLSDGADVAISSEQAPDWAVEGVGEPPPIYSLDVNGVDDTCCQPRDEARICRHRVYLDYRLRHAHLCARRAGVAAAYLRAGRCHWRARGRASRCHAAADGGPRHESQEAHGGPGGRSWGERDWSGGGSHYQGSLRGASQQPRRLHVHVSSLRRRVTRTDEAAGILRETPGVERVYSREEAAEELRLNYDRIGDLVVTGDIDTVFGPKELEDSWDDTGAGHSLRSHASAHEQDVPIIGYNGDFDGLEFTENRDIGRYVFERVLG